MKKIIEVTNFTSSDSLITYTPENNSIVVDYSCNGGVIFLQGAFGSEEQIQWKDSQYIVFDAVNNADHVICIHLEFFEESNTSVEPNLRVRIGLMPNLKTRLSLPVKALNGQRLYLDRTPGKLKTAVKGKRVDIEKVNRFGIRAGASLGGIKLEISNFYISDCEPDYPLPEVKLLDELGQYTLRDWPGKTHGIDDLKTYLQSEAEKAKDSSFPEQWSIYGGWKDKKFEATGFFRTQHDGRRWWLVDPEGYAFFSNGLDCIRPGVQSRIDGIEKFCKWIPEEEGEFKEAWAYKAKYVEGKFVNYGIINLSRAFGQQWYENWLKINRGRMIRWGFNTIGNWSEPAFINSAKIPYVYQLDEFPDTKDKIFRDFPDVFSEEYSINAEEYAKQVLDYREDKYLIGYFLRNEPGWAFIQDLNVAEELLENESMLASRIAFIEFITNRYYGGIEEFNKAWNTNFCSFEKLKGRIVKAASLSKAAEKDTIDFTKILIDRYIKVPSEAVKKLDSNHLNLGMRYAMFSSENLKSGCQYFDVFSINCYSLDPSKVIETVGRETGLPVLIGEYHFGALDRGLLATGIKGVVSQEERGKAFKYYLENAAASEYGVGVHYFTLGDQSVLGRFDGENYQIGLVDVCERPYEEFIKGIIETSHEFYEVADGRREKYGVMPKEIPSLF
jgi:hypothetical protein